MARRKPHQQKANRKKTDRQVERLILRGEALKVFVNAILNPPLPNEALRAAAQLYKKQMGYQ